MKVTFGDGALINFQSEFWSLHLGKYPGCECVYLHWFGSRKERDGDWWVWGRATECYECCLEYFGLGPILLVCWAPGPWVDTPEPKE